MSPLPIGALQLINPAPLVTYAELFIGVIDLLAEHNHYF